MISSPPTSPRNSLHGRSGTPDIIEPEGGGGGFNLADELAMAEEDEEDNNNTGFLIPPVNRNSTVISDYEGSEYGDPDDDSDGYLSDHIDVDEVQLQRLVEEVTGNDAQSGIVGRFMQDLRGMRGQMVVENKARRYYANIVGG